MLRLIEKNSTEKLWKLLRSLPLSQADNIFVELKESEFWKCVELQLTSEEEQGSAFITDTDKLRFIVFFTRDDVIDRHLKVQRVIGGGPNGELSLHNSDARDKECYELMVILFNDPSVEAKTNILPTLHSRFSDAIDCLKGNYDLTEEKVKN